MCLLALLYRVVPDYPVVLGANRDEFLDRPGRPPSQIAPGVWAGLDPTAGGTWLGVNDAGVLVALANVADGAGPPAGVRSRGLLCRDLLCARAPAGELIGPLRDRVARHVYQPFNLLIADAASAHRATWHAGALDVEPLSSGVHVVANMVPGQPDPKIVRARSLLGEPAGIDEAIALLTATCRDRGSTPGAADAICVRRPDRGTLSSTIVAVHVAGLRRSRYLFADGPPDRTDYQDLSRLLGRGL